MATVDTKHATNDEHAVRAVISDIEAAWNRHDMRRFSELFAPNADFVTTVGSRFKGRAEIERLHTTLHASHYKDSHQTTGEVTVRFLRSDVALAHLPSRVIFGEGKNAIDTLMALVLTKGAGEAWLIAAAQNTISGVPPAFVLDFWKAAAENANR
jgi:uncharacterized protein (TIGR02246 family)